MRVFVTGATGFVGQPLCQRLLRDGHQVTALVRDARRARLLLGTHVACVVTRDTDAIVGRALANCDAVINLAGEGLFSSRWTQRRRRSLYVSRIATTERLVRLLAHHPQRPSVLISGSGLGYYGVAPRGEIRESSPPGSGFLARLCRDWEAAANAATEHGLRVVTLRTGIVLGLGGGALAKLLPIFRLGLGARLGDGEQPMSWIHIRDLLDIIVSSLGDDRFHGPINLVSPNPVSNAQFTALLADALGRPHGLRMPALALKLAVGPVSSVLLGGQRAVPRKLQKVGFVFEFPTLKAALQDLVVVDPRLRIHRARDRPSSPYLEARGARYELRQETRIEAPLANVFEFFSNAENIALLMPRKLGFAVASSLPADIQQQTSIDYTLRVKGLPLRWRTEIEHWLPDIAFVDTQVHGPYHSWWHEHSFQAEGDHTIMKDRVLYSPPLGPIGWLAHRLLLKSTLTRIFDYRSKALALYFGRPRPRRAVLKSVI